MICDQMLSALEAQHRAIDALFAMLISLTANTDKPFFPSQSGWIWDATAEGNAIITKARKINIANFPPLTDPPIRELPAAEPRVETGPVQFGSDWPGTFFRGDSAAGYAHHLECLLENNLDIDGITRGVLRSLLRDLDSSNLIKRMKISRE